MKYSNNMLRLIEIAKELDLSEYILGETLGQFDDDKDLGPIRRRIERDLFGEGEDNDN